MKFQGTVSFKIYGEADSLKIFKQIVRESAECSTVIGAGDRGYYTFRVSGKPFVMAVKRKPNNPRGGE